MKFFADIMWHMTSLYSLYQKLLGGNIVKISKSNLFMGMIGILALLTLSACSNATVTAKNSNDRNTSSSSSMELSSSMKKKLESYANPQSSEDYDWTNKNGRALDKFMQKYAKSVGHNFTKVTKNSNTDWFGTNLSEYAKANKTIKDDDRVFKTRWFEKKYDEDRLNIVAAYIDQTNHILYLFINAGTAPEISESNEKLDPYDGKLVCEENDDKTLEEGFRAAFNNKVGDVDESTNTQTTQSSSSDSQNQSSLKNDESASNESSTADQSDKKQSAKINSGTDAVALLMSKNDPNNPVQWNFVRENTNEFGHYYYCNGDHQQTIEMNEKNGNDLHDHTDTLVYDDGTMRNANSGQIIDY